MKERYFKDLMKHFIWTFLDYVFRFMFISILWFFFNIPFLYTVFVLVYSKMFYPVYFILLFIVINYSPVSLGAFHYVLQIVSQSASSKKLSLFPKFESTKLIKISVFFKGVFKYFFQSIFLMLVMAFISLFFYYNIYFYWKILTPKIPLVGLILTGFILWLAAIFYLMQIYIIPLVLTKKLSPFRALYQSFLLVADNVLYCILVGILITSLFIIMAFTVAGIFLIFYGAISLLQLLCFLIIYQKYDETLQINKEHRTFKDVIKPWG